MRWDVISWVIVVVVVLLVVLIIIIWRTSELEMDEIISTTGSFLDHCSESVSCQPGLICDIDGLCKQELGEPCQTAGDCETNVTTYCSGTCKNTSPAAVTGRLGDPCPCQYNQQACVSGICLSLTTCTINSDCVTGQCIGTSCAPQQTNGQSCQANPQCLSGNCSENLCQPFGVVSGQLGSYCTILSDCRAPLVCQNGQCHV